MVFAGTAVYNAPGAASAVASTVGEHAPAIKDAARQAVIAEEEESKKMKKPKKSAG